ncbi:hypothetical protein [Streptomyces parvus]|uniref:hypothetical protein n=1 Tax=Streptomyces parvus TaxID=66428 RepID=UPI0037991221
MGGLAGQERPEVTRQRPSGPPDTVDPLDNEHNPTGTQLTFSSPGTDPSHLPVPLREK